MSVNYSEYVIEDIDIWNTISNLNLNYTIDNYEILFFDENKDCVSYNGKHIPEYEVILKKSLSLDNCSRWEIFNYFKKDLVYLTMARVWGMNSYSSRKKVGALIINNNMIISDGYNGTPNGFSNICECEDGLTKDIVLHAEANCITKLAKSTNNSMNSTLYTTLAPCLECSKLIHQAGISKVVFSEHYRDFNGIKFLLNAHISVLYIPKFAINLNLTDSIDKEEIF